MKIFSYDEFKKCLDKRLSFRRPIYGYIELTYRCNYNCIHCYCKDTKNSNRELNFTQWKDIIDQIYSQGGLYLTLSGGEPLLHNDFLKIYDYARKKGFLITIYSNGYSFNNELIDYFAEIPPLNIEITLNGITAPVYEGITQLKGAFGRVMLNIKKMKKKRLPLVLKTNGLKENKSEILKIKKFIYDFLGKGKYKFDPFITPSLEGGLAPIRHRLTPDETLEIEFKDPDMQMQRLNESMHARYLGRRKEHLYQCNAGINSYCIDPCGLLKACHLSRKYFTDLTRNSFRQGFYNRIPQLLKQKYKGKSECILCRYRKYCYKCPPLSFFEAGNEEAPIQHFCELAKRTYKNILIKS